MPARSIICLENEIVPMFYDRKEQTPREWMRRMKQSLMYITPQFDCRRMVREYMTELYEPAHEQHMRMMGADYALLKQKVAWDKKIREAWDRVKFVESGPAPAGSVISGRPVPVRAAIDLAGLDPSDVRVEVVIGQRGQQRPPGRNRSGGAPSSGATRIAWRSSAGTLCRSAPAAWVTPCA